MSSKIAVVTGTSSGIGLLSAVELAKDGFFIVATMRDPGRRQHLDETAKAAGVQDKIEVRQLAGVTRAPFFLANFLLSSEPFKPSYDLQMGTTPQWRRPQKGRSDCVDYLGLRRAHSTRQNTALRYRPSGTWRR